MEVRHRVGFIVRAVASLLSGGLLALAFPPRMESSAAWFAFIPLLSVAYHSSPRASFRWGWISGFAFWLLSMGWLLKLGDTGGPLPLVVAGWILLAAYCSLFTGWFLLGASALFAGLLGGTPAGEGAPLHPVPMWRRMAALLAIPALWVGLEYWRSTVITGFPWNALGVSQFLIIPVVQIAEWSGVYGVSAVIMLVNVGLMFAGVRVVRAILRRRVTRFNVEMLVALGAVVACCMYGLERVKATIWIDEDGVVIGAVQPNIPQEKKWPDAYAFMVSESLEAKTGQLEKYAPDLIVWPETSVPGVLPHDAGAMAFVRNLAAKGSPILVGAIEPSNRSAIRRHSLRVDPSDEPEGRMPRYYNSAMLFVPSGAVRGVYRKQHLVPFGEYLPMDGWFAAIERLAPLGFLCDPGATTTVFRVECGSRPRGDNPGDDPGRGGRSLSFSALICFEDIFAHLARRAVRKGARMLVNQTNDAWFDGTSGAIQHISHSVFRCVENRVPMVRSANTGVTGLIDRTGRLDTDTLLLLRTGDTRSVEWRVGEICVERDEKALTFYTRLGDWPFAVPCGLFALVVLARAWRRSGKMMLESSRLAADSRNERPEETRSDGSQDPGEVGK